MSTLSDLINEVEPQIIQNNPEPVPSASTQEPTNSTERTPYETAINGENGKTPLPTTNLSMSLDKFIMSFNDVMSGLQPGPMNNVPSQESVEKEGEMNMDDFNDAIFALTNEFTKAAATWQLRFPEEAYADEAKDLKKTIERQNLLIKRTKDRLSAETSKQQRQHRS